MKNILKNNWFIVGIIIVLIGFDIFIHIPIIDIKSSYFGAIIGFVGILATFIVVSNYAQVNNIEKKFDERIKKYDTKISELDSKISEQNSEISNIEKRNKVDNIIYTVESMQEIAIALFAAKEYQSCFYISFRALEIITTNDNELFEGKITDIVYRLCNIIKSYDIESGKMKIKVSDYMKLINRMKKVVDIIGSSTPTDIIITYLENIDKNKQ